MSTQTWDPAQANLVSITDAALEHFRKQLASQSDKTAIRLGIKKSGCSGFKYDIDFVAAAADTDTVQMIAADLPLYITQEAAAVVAGTQIDYERVGLNSSIKFNNPNASNQCGCGESFSA